ncbi:hypothetical protein C8T65DRAFT_743327 [Cerioporus squamosus]|nr:hypothetical protein C8T65DRAFT_743327 [Cerioporus squamosus]
MGSSVTDPNDPYCLKKLTKEANAMLSKFYNDVSSSPTVAQCRALTLAIRQLPECEWCTVPRVRRYFMARRCYEGRKPLTTKPRARPPFLGSAPRSNIPAGTSSSAQKVQNNGPLFPATQMPVAAPKSFSTQPAASRNIAPTILKLHPMPSPHPRPRLYFDYGCSMPHPGAYILPWKIIYRPPESRAPHYFRHYSSTQSCPSPVHWANPVSAPPQLIDVPPLRCFCTLPQTDLPLHQLAAQLEDALTDSPATLTELPKTPTDLMRRIGDQQASKDLLRAINEPLYSRVGLSPSAWAPGLFYG